MKYLTLLCFSIILLSSSFWVASGVALAQVYDMGTPVTPAPSGGSGGGGQFVPLVGIPYVEDINDQGAGLGGYANSLFYAAISIAAILAVLKIAFAGVKYMLTDIVTQKGQARKDITNALLGLLIVISTFLILDTINPSLTGLNVLSLEALGVEQRERVVTRGPEDEAACLTASITDATCIQEMCDGEWVQFNEVVSGCVGSIINEEADGFEDDNITITGDVRTVTGGRAEVNEYIAQAEQDGQSVVFNVGPYNQTSGDVTRNNYINDCQQQGGTNYQVFESGANGAEIFVCY